MREKTREKEKEKKERKRKRKRGAWEGFCVIVFALSRLESGAVNTIF